MVALALSRDNAALESSHFQIVLVDRLVDQQAGWKDILIVDSLTNVQGIVSEEIASKARRN